MFDERIDYDRILQSCGCDNCFHDSDGRWSDFCEKCNPDYTPPSKYHPARGTIQEKYLSDGVSSITYEEYVRFLRDRK